ncbi:nucleotidyltransferase family protein isoform X2 [Carex rostrata]
MRILRKKGIGRKFQFIPQARVPLLVYESSLYGISCDVSVDNHQGRVKSKMLQLITSFDERFTDMVLLIKEWAKAQNINDPKTGTMNSYSLCMLVIFHFQTCTPPILPPLKEIYSGNISDDVEGVDIEREREIEDICALNVQKIISHISSHRNQSSLTNLLVSFFDKFSDIEALSSEYVICPFTGRWERMASNPRWTEKSYSFYIEDPFEQPDNTARAVGPQDLKTIAGVFHVTRQLLSSSSVDSVLSDRSSILRLLSRPLVSSRLIAPKKTTYFSTYTPQQANKHQYTNMYGIQQGVLGSAESSLNRDRTTRIRTTGIVDTYPNHSTQISNGSNLSQKGNQSEKPPYYSSYRVPEDQIHRNIGIRFAGQTPERFDRRYDSSSSGMHRTGMASVEQSKDPSLIKNRQSQSHQRVGYSTTPPGSFDLNYDAGMNGMNGMHRSGLAIVEPVTEQLNHSLNLNGQHSGSRSKGKQIWQPRGANNQGFL